MAQQHKHQFARLEEQLLQAWQAEQTFEASLKQREGCPRFSFYDGPPYANGLPHHGHVVPVSIKDAITRYKTMRGYYVPRRLGWDTHGLPVEYQIEKELGFKSKKDILDYGIDKFNQASRDSVFRYKAEWERFFERIGRWADAEHAYATLENSYIESIWWVFARVHKKGLIFKGYRSMPYCPRCGTPLSNFELNQGYQDGVEDPSLFVKFRLKNPSFTQAPEDTSQDVYLVAWTTTPWSLPGNAALGVGPDVDYAHIRYTNDKNQTEQLVLAKDRLEIIDGEYEVLREFKGRELVGATYEPPFELQLDQFETNDNLYKVWEADFVSTEEGTGIVHVAPAFGEDDLLLAEQHDIPILQTVDEDGLIKTGIGLGQDSEGVFFKIADKALIDQLTHHNKVFAAETMTHTYPFCWRCDTPLLYYAVDTWFLDVPKIKDRLLKNNQAINWVPQHIRDGRFGNWLEDARDWGISRNRFWGAPIPLWRCQDDHYNVIGSLEELKQQAIDLPGTIDMHRPAIDEIRIRCSECGKEAARIEEIFDVWFESGSMPYAQDHYPFENEALFKKTFPADFIAESIDQTRGWFYTLHVLASALFDKPAAETIMVSGWVVAADGQKLSKRLKNYAPLDEVFDEYGADTLRYFMLTSPVVAAESVRFSKDALKEVQRNVFMTLWNVKNFFTTYAGVDAWEPPADLDIPQSDNVLDQWIVSRLHSTLREVTDEADQYQVAKATRPIMGFIDDLSNWYVRRSRRRFWKSGSDRDKDQAYATLHYVLVRTCQMLAPWAPFISDAIYRDLRGSAMPRSVHLTDWPMAGDSDDQLLRQMAVVRDIITEGLNQRADAGIKVRQPLGKATVAGESLPAEWRDIIRDELNVKEVVVAATGRQASNVVLDTNITPALRREGAARDLIRQVQQFRKECQLDVDDRIELALVTNDQATARAISEHADTIKSETLAVTLDTKESRGESKTVAVGGADVTISLRKQ